MTTTLESLGIDIEIRPNKAGSVEIDRALRRNQETAKATSRTIAAEARATAQAQAAAARESARAVTSEARATAAALRSHERAILTESRQAAQAGKDAKRAVAEETRKAAQAEREHAQAIARSTAELRKQHAAAEASFASLNKRNRGPKRLGDDDMTAYTGKRGPGVGDAAAAGMGRMVAGAVMAVGVSEAMNLADGWTEYKNRIKDATTSTAEMLQVQRGLFVVAQDTAVGIGGLAELYQQVGKSTKEMGLSTGDAIKTIELITKQMRASGASGAGADAAIRQLSQGFATGVIRGEEFNSVAEQAPGLLDVVAKSLGKTRGELRLMANDGQLTAKAFTAAILSQEASINEAFGKRLPTMRDELVRFKNELSKTFGELSQNAGIGKLFGETLRGIADGLRAIADVAGVVTGAITTLNSALGGLPADVLSFAAKNGKYLIPGVGVMLLGKDIIGAMGTPDPDAGSGGEAFRDAEAVSRGEMSRAEMEERAFARRADAATAERFKSNWWDGPVTNRDVDDVRARREALEAERKAADLAKGKAGFGSLTARRADARSLLSPTGQTGPLTPEQQAEFTAQFYGGAADDRVRAKADKEKTKTDKKTARTEETDAKKQARELAELRREYDAFGSSLSSVERAEIELSKAEDLLERATSAGFTTREDALEQLARKRDALRDQLDPLGAVVRGLDEENRLLALSKEDRERQIEMTRIQNDLRRQGVELGAAEILQLEMALDRQEQAKDAAAKREREAEATRDAADALRDFKESYALLTREVAEYEQAQRDAVAAAANAIDKGFKNDILQRMSSGFDSALRSAIEFKNGFSEIAESFARDVAFMAAKMAALAGIRSIFGATAGTQFGSGAGGFLGGLITGQYGGGMAGGGTYMVPGSGGVDSRNVMFRVTPGERIHFTPPGQAGPASGGAASSGGGPTFISKVVNHVNIADALAEYARSSEFERATLNVVVANIGKLQQAQAR